MPIAWITAPNGTPTFGTIPAITSLLDVELCCPAGEIRLQVGDIAQGYTHLSTQERLARISGQTVEQFVYGITSAYDEIWVQRGRGSLLLKRVVGGHRVTSVSLTLVEGHYSVLTAFPVPRGWNHRRRREVRIWPR